MLISQTGENRSVSPDSNAAPESRSASSTWPLRLPKRRVAAASATLGEIVARSVLTLGPKNSKNYAPVVPGTNPIRRLSFWRTLTNARSTRTFVKMATVLIRLVVLCAPVTRVSFWTTLKPIA